jgi:hypothetical protein
MRCLLLQAGVLGRPGRSTRPTSPIRSARVRGRLLIHAGDVIAYLGGRPGRGS